MNTGTKLLLTVITVAVIYEITIGITETMQRHSYYKWAREYCDKVKKPLLRIGMQRSFLEPPNGDYTLDIDPEVQNLPGGVVGDERFMPFEDKQFGVCFNEHTLEHLHSIDDVEKAIAECRRVADRTVLLCPSPYSIWATFFCPSHRLRIWFDKENDKIFVKPNTWRSGLGKRYDADTGGLELPSSGRTSGIIDLKYNNIDLPVILDQ
jgi:hypothetical protein